MTRMVILKNIDDDEEENFDVKVEWPPEQRKKICITASGHPWYPCQFGFNGDDISEDFDEKDNLESVGPHSRVTSSTVSVINNQQVLYN